MKEVSAYKCDHCSMVSLYKGHVKRHESTYCRRSPDRRTCVLCTLYENDFEDGPYCIDDQVPFDPNNVNGNNDCEFFKSKIIS